MNIKDLRAKIEYMNARIGLTGDRYTYYDDGRIPGGIEGTYILSGAYGGYALHRMCKSTGVNDVFSAGYMTKRELSDRISAYLIGSKGE